MIYLIAFISTSLLVIAGIIAFNYRAKWIQERKWRYIQATDFISYARKNIFFRRQIGIDTRIEQHYLSEFEKSIAEGYYKDFDIIEKK